MSSNHSFTPLSREVVDAHGPWFQNFHIDGIQTAPGHPLGNYPDAYFQRFAHAFPADLSGWSVLEIGCNAGFYAFEMKRRGAARVVAIDSEPLYLRQARLLATRFGLDVEFQERSVYDVGSLGERFDLVLFMGVLYHLRHPLLALDIVRHKARGHMVLQTMTMPDSGQAPVPADLGLDERQQLQSPGWPRMAFIEHRLAGDPTNWWAPNSACVLAMLRSAGFEIEKQLAHETWLCNASGKQHAFTERELDAIVGKAEARNG
jgi:tRNA (mo5U34)-methyltransferase